MERVVGIEPTWPAWKAGTLPLSYTRDAGGSLPGKRPMSTAEGGAISFGTCGRAVWAFEFFPEAGELSARGHHASPEAEAGGLPVWQQAFEFTQGNPFQFAGTPDGGKGTDLKDVGHALQCGA